MRVLKQYVTKKRILTGIILTVISFMWLNNTNLFIAGSDSEFRFLAHRGLAQVFNEEEADCDSNTAAMIEEPTHSFIENTIPSIQAAFDLGAAAVEFDIKCSKDKQLAVFHDSTLLFRCGVEGEVQDYTMAELKQMDVGYGYTADNGKKYPLRGEGVGLMPTMNEVLDSFPDKEFIIDVKDGKIETYEVLWENLSSLPPERLERLSICCAGEDGASYLRIQNPELKVMSKKSMIKALLEYELLGWTGYVPESMRNTELRIPLDYAKFLWGWPDKFMFRMNESNTRVVITAGNGMLSEGFDTKESMDRVPEGFSGYIWTNRIDIVNPDSLAGKNH